MFPLMQSYQLNHSLNFTPTSISHVNSSGLPIPVKSPIVPLWKLFHNFLPLNRFSFWEIVVFEGLFGVGFFKKFMVQRSRLLAISMIITLIGIKLMGIRREI